MHRERWLGKPRRGSGTASAANFRPLRAPVGPDGNAGKHSWLCAPEILQSVSGGATVMGSRGTRIWARSAHPERLPGGSLVTFCPYRKSLAPQGEPLQSGAPSRRALQASIPASKPRRKTESPTRLRREPPFTRGPGREGQAPPLRFSKKLSGLGRGGPWASRRGSHRFRWLGKPRRGSGTALVAIFVSPGPSGPAGI